LLISQKQQIEKDDNYRQLFCPKMSVSGQRPSIMYRRRNSVWNKRALFQQDWRMQLVNERHFNPSDIANYFWDTPRPDQPGK
jgi:hypothetical protein